MIVLGLNWNFYSDDPTWAHGQVVAGVKNASICIYCNKRINGGGVTRLKYHLAGIKGEVEPCKRVPPDVKWQMKQLVDDMTMEKERRKRIDATLRSLFYLIRLDNIS